MRKLIIDRFEGNLAVCEEEGSEKLFGIDRKEIPAQAVEGSVLEISDEGEISINNEETQKRRERILARQKKLFQ